MEVVLGEEGICHHLMLVLWAGYICCRAFFGIHFLPVFVASLDPTLGLAQSHGVGVSPCPPMVPSPVRLSPGLVKLTWELRGCASMAGKA